VVLSEIQTKLNEAELIIFFNAKFDLHWLRRYGLTLPRDCRVWCCQLAEFLLGNQTEAYPSLNGACEKRGLGQKVDEVAKMWALGIDTPDIPITILQPYLEGDLSLTYQLYLKQIEEFLAKPELYRLFKLQCLDLLVLAEMEWNGFKYNVDASLAKAKEERENLGRIEKRLNELVSVPGINWNSGDHLSCVLYGGTISINNRVPIGVYKTGIKEGTEKWGWVATDYALPRLVEPLRRTKLKKEGYWRTGVEVLEQLPAKGTCKLIIELVLEYSKLEKLIGTYYEGIPETIAEHNWKDNIVHGKLNQVVARTGRLSASEPNQQNMPPDADFFIESRYV
jgi:DNA polymerase I-like protein with 3'-5' exonuclease and polymerase domains